MEGQNGRICLWLTRAEADEILSRLLQSQDGDTPTFQTALLQLAKAMNADQHSEMMDAA
jgi:hypothetical protein